MILACLQGGRGLGPAVGEHGGEAAQRCAQQRLLLATALTASQNLKRRYEYLGRTKISEKIKKPTFFLLSSGSRTTLELGESNFEKKKNSKVSLKVNTELVLRKLQ